MRNQFKFIFMCLFVLAFSACTRAPETSNVSFSLSLPSTGQNGSTAAGDQLMHVAINVTGPGIASPIIYSWDGHQNGTKLTAPSSFAFDVAQGDSRLVQVLAVYQNETSGTMSFTYGDTTTAISGANVSLTVTMAPIGAGSSVQGQISGRYLTGTDSGPTGIIDVNFNPGGGKRSLIIEKSFMANGWFSVFSLSGVQFEYMMNGVPLFGGPVNLDSAAFVPAAGNLNQIVRAAIPTMVRANGGGGDKEFENAQIYIWGFWNYGGDVSAKSVCNDLSAGAFSKIFRYNAVPASANTLLTLSNATIGTVPTYPAYANLLDKVSPLSAVTAGGGVGPTCASSTPSLNVIPVTKALIDGNGKDNSAGFRNIFLNSATGSPLTITGTGTTATVTGSVLPGISSVYDRIKFYKRIGTPNSNFRIETPFCKDIDSGASNFIWVGEATSINAGTGAFSASNVNIDTTSAAYSDGSMSIVACGASGPANADLAQVGLFQEIYSGGGGGGKYLRIELTGAPNTSGTINATAGECYPMNFNLYENGTNFNATAAVTISNINPGSTWYDVYTEASCTTPYSNGTPVTIAIGEQTNVGGGIYFKSTSTGAAQLFSTVTVSGTDNFSYTPASNLVNVGSPSFLISAPNDILPYSSGSYCYQFSVQRLDQNGFPMNSSSPISPSLSITGGGASVYANLGDCQAGTPTASGFTIAANSSFANLYVRGDSASSSNNVSVATIGSYPAAVKTISVSGASASPLASKFILNPVSLYAGLCNALDILHVNSAGDEIPTPSPINITLGANSNDVQFYTDSSCGSLIPDKIFNFGGGMSQARIYFVPSLAIGTSLALTATTGSMNGASTAANVTAPSAGQEPYATFSIPVIKSTILGAHDFATPKVINFSLSAGATISCELASGPSFNVWTPCSGQMTGTTFSWNSTDAVGGYGFRFTVSAAGKPNKEYKFIPAEIYSRFGQMFTVKNCDITLTANGTTDFGAINTEFSGAPTNICLNAGTFTHPSTTPSISPSGTKFLIGSTDASGNPTSILQAVGGTDLVSIATGSPTFANIDIAGALSGSANNLVNIPGSAGTAYKSVNNIYRVNAAHTSGIFRTGLIRFESYADTFIVDGTTSSTNGIYSACSSCGSASVIKSPLFKLSSAATETPFATAITLYNSPIGLDVVGAKVDPSFNQGSFLSLDNSSGTNSATINISDSVMSFAGTSANNNRFPIYISRKANVTLNTVKIVNSTASDTIRAVSNFASFDLSLQFTDTKIVNLEDQRAVFLNNFDGASTSYDQTITTSRTHFVRAGSAGNTAVAVQIATPTQVYWNFTGPVSGSPDTYFCGTSANPNFSAAYSGSSIFGGPPNPPASTPTNTADASNLVCQ
jgi:hypothetical protein